MKEEKKVYIVTAGDYSDYRIIGVFDSKEKADEYVDCSTEYDIHEPDEWTLNEEQPDRNEKVFSIYSPFADIDPRIMGAYSAEEFAPHEKNSVHYGKGGITLHIASISRGKALKIATERIRQVKAEEHFRYPLLRRCVVLQHGSDIPNEYPAYDFHTGEIILEEHQELMKGACPEGLEHSLKIRRVKK